MFFVLVRLWESGVVDCLRVLGMVWGVVCFGIRGLVVCLFFVFSF